MPYDITWLNTKSGIVERRERIVHTGGGRMLPSPAYTKDIALRVNRAD